MIRKALLILVLAEAPLVVSAQTAQETFPTRAIGASIESLQQLLVTYWDWRLANFPELATQLGRTEFNDRWRDWSKAARDRHRASRKEFLQQAVYIGAGNMTAADRLNVHVLEWELRSALDSEDYNNLVGRVSQMNGLHLDVFTVINQMPARRVKDYENIIARLRGVPVYVDQHLELLREQVGAALVQPPIVVDLMLEQVTAQLRMPAAESPLLAAFRRMPADISPADRQRLLAQATAAYDQEFIPGWRRLETFLRDTYRPRARAGIALTSVGDGRRLYDVAVRFHTTTSMTADQIHDLGLKEVARIEREIEAIARADGFSGPVADYEQELARRPGARFTSQQEMINYARDVLGRLQPALPTLFKRTPKMRVQIRPIPADREASTASNYEAGTTDGTRPGWFNMNTYRPQEQVKYVTEALVLHETVPGHHLQTDR